VAEYVEISTSIADIINIATSISSQGETLHDAMGTAISEIERLERLPQTFGDDDYKTSFFKTYQNLVPGADGKQVPANEAVKGSGRDIGGAMQSMGDYVADVMWSYQGQDEDNGKSIASTPLV
jgi:hypothetical protein